MRSSKYTVVLRKRLKSLSNANRTESTNIKFKNRDRQLIYSIPTRPRSAETGITKGRNFGLL